MFFFVYGKAACSILWCSNIFCKCIWSLPPCTILYTLRSMHAHTTLFVLILNKSRQWDFMFTYASVLLTSHFANHHKCNKKMNRFAFLLFLFVPSLFLSAIIHIWCLCRWKRAILMIAKSQPSERTQTKWKCYFQIDHKIQTFILN